MALKKHYFDVKKKLFLESGFSFANFTLLNGIFIIGFALAIGANNLQLGIITAIPLFANLLQLVSAFVLEVTGRKKITTIHSLLTSRLIWVFIILIALGVIEKNITLVIIILIVSNSLNAIGSLSLLSWTKDIVPIRKLARFLGKKNIYASSGGIIVYLIGSYFIDRFPSLKTYAYLFITAVIIGILGMIYLKDIPDRKRKIKAINPKKYLNRLRIPFKDSNFKPLLKFGLIWGFAINLSAPFFLVFMINDLKLKFLTISFFLAMHALSRIYGLNIWRKIADKFGAKPLLTVSSTITSMIPLAYIFININNYYFILLILVIAAFSYSAVDIAIGQLLFKSAPKKYDAYYLSTFGSLIGFASALGPIVGGLMAELIAKNEWPLLTPLKWVFLTSFIIRTASLPYISSIEEKKAKNVSVVIERMKNLKFASFFVPIYSFSHYASKIVLFPQKQFFILQRKAAERTKDLKKINNIFFEIPLLLNKLHTKITLHSKRKIIQIKKQLDKEMDKLDYTELVHSVPNKVVSKMDALESSFEKGTKTEIKKQVTSVKKFVEEGKEKIETAVEQEVK